MNIKIIVIKILCSTKAVLKWVLPECLVTSAMMDSKKSRLRLELILYVNKSILKVVLNTSPNYAINANLLIT